MAAPHPDTLGEHGELAPGPPWIFGLRGAPREAPENTLASLRRALALGLDGVTSDVRSCASGDFVLCADASVDRTSDAHGALADLSPSELGEIDAGGWFAKSFSGERIAFLEEALALPGNAAGSRPQHLLVVREPASLPALARFLSEHARKLSVRVLSDHRAVCTEARDLGLSPLYLAPRAAEAERRFARDERIAAVGARWSAWASDAGAGEWPCERFAMDIDDPDELLAACRRPINALVTTEPRRALAVRALVKLAPDDRGPFPLRADALEVAPQFALPGQGEWCGRWDVGVRVRNPFPFAVAVALELVVRRGAFDAPDLPQSFELAAGEERELRLCVQGGAWSPGGDPLLVARLSDPGREGARPFLVLDWPLRRVRHVTALEAPLRLPLLRESPGDPPASVTLRRQRGDLLVALEVAGDLEPARLLVHLDGDLFAGARGVRLPLPSDFGSRPGGVPFSVGIEGLRRTPRGPRTVVRRWSGGLPDTLAAGEPGRLLAGR